MPPTHASARKGSKRTHGRPQTSSRSARQLRLHAGECGLGAGDDRQLSGGQAGSAVIPLLWRAQEQHDNWLPEPAMRLVADMLGMAYIRVYEVATFYTMFQLSPVGQEGARAGVRHDAVHAARRGGAGRGVPQPHPPRSASPFGRRQFLLGGGRVPGRVRQRADGADLQGYLRGPDAGAVREGAGRLRQRQSAQARLADRPAGVVSRGRADDAQRLRQGWK